MDSIILNEVKNIIVHSVGSNIKVDSLSDDYELVGNLLDSMSITNLILALEENYDFFFDDDELSAEAFESVQSLAVLVEKKLGKSNAF